MQQIEEKYAHVYNVNVQEKIRKMAIVVQLKSHLLRKTVNIIMLSHILLHCFLNGGGDKEILLLQAQLLSCVMIVIGIEHLHNISGQILLLHRLAVIAHVKGCQRLHQPYHYGRGSGKVAHRLVFQAASQDLSDC